MACRENNWSLESATFYTEVTEFQNPDQIEERPKSGCYACDILIEGAAWGLVADNGDNKETVGTNNSGGARGGLGTDSKSKDGEGVGHTGNGLVRAKLRNPINPLPIIRIIPVEMHKLKLQVRQARTSRESGRG